MPAPTASDGFSRAVVEMAAPPVGVFLTVIFTKEFVGGLTAGIVYILLTAAIFIGIVTSAKYWNLRYLGSFLPAALVLFFMMPNFMSEVIHPIFTVFGSLVTLVGLLVLVLVLFKKAGIDEVLST
jgi:hypothetical protein